MTDLHRSSVLPNVQVEATLPRILAAPMSRAFGAMPALEANFLLSLLGFVAVVGLLLFILLMVIASYFVLTRYIWTLKARILKYLVQLLPEPVVRLLTPTTSPSAVAAAADDA